MDGRRGQSGAPDELPSPADPVRPVVADLWSSGERPVRIRRVRTICTAPEGARLVVVKVETDEPGLFGLGCASSALRPQAVVAAIDSLRPMLIGRDVQDIEDIVQTAHLSSYWRSGPILNSAVSGVDMALWDIKAKRAGMPLYQLFGGKTRKAAEAYCHVGGRDVAEVEEHVRQRMSEGFRHIRCQLSAESDGGYGGGESSQSPWLVDAGRYDVASEVFDAAAYCRSVPRLFEHLRSTVGEEIELLHDVHERVSPSQAVQLARNLEQFDLFFLEDPLSIEDYGHLPRLRQQTSTPLAIGELFVNPAEYVPLVQNRLIDFIRAHVAAIGGITPARKLAVLGEAFGVRTAWHGPSDVSPVGHAANLHLDLASPNFGVQEAHLFGEAAREVFPGTPRVEDGMVWCNEAPGLGIDVDEAAAARFPYPDHPLGVAWPWPPIRHRDGSVVRP